MKYKKIISMILIFSFLFSISISVFADDKAKTGEDDNAETGEGEYSGYTHAFYRGAEWMYKASIYVGLSDTANTDTPIDGYKLIGEPVYWRPNFSMPSNTHFTKYNKIQYLNGAPLETYQDEIYIVDNKVPRIPITHDGNINNLKSFFGDTDTLNATIVKIAETYGTSREALVSSIPFTINGETRTRDPNIILPIKGDDGKYKNVVPWVIIYEPVIITHLRDGQTRVAFTATEYAITQKLELFDWFYNGSTSQYVAGMSHINLPNSLVLEHDWFGFRAYPPLSPEVYWANDRIINGGGWGMRILRPGERYEPDEEEEEENIELRNIDIGDYRTDTDVITSFWVKSDYEINSDNPGYVDFYIDGTKKARQWVVLPEGGSQLVWVKWHTPKKPKTVNIQAIASQGDIQGSSSINKKVVDLNEYEPPDPRAKDFKTGKVIEKPKGFKIKAPPSTNKSTSNEWSVYYDWWQENWVWHPNWVDEGWWSSSTWTDEEGETHTSESWTSDWVDRGEWVDEGWYEFDQHHYSASIWINKNDIAFKPDEKVPTAFKQYAKWTMKSGYGWNLDTKLKCSTNDYGNIASQGNSITYLPEYKYKGYLRLSERIRNREFKLKNNRYSTFNNRVHFTPLWYPNDEYTIYTRLIDIWTPAGHLYTDRTDTMNIQGSVLDDYKVVPSKGM